MPLKRNSARTAFAVFLALLFSASVSRAHEPSRSYLLLTLESNRLTGRWDIALRDLQFATPPVVTPAGLVDWDKLRARHRELAAYVLKHLAVSADGQPLALEVSNAEPTVEDFPDGPYLEFSLAANLAAPPKSLKVGYQLFFATNSLHRGLLRLDLGGQKRTAIFSPFHTAEKFETASRERGTFLLFLREGILHIWTGYDHVLFLLALLLPSVLLRENGQWECVNELRPAFLNVVKIVTAFTLAHSLTLSLAALDLVRPPPRLTESVIALTVLLVAANNLKPVVRERGWLAAFAFGLMHGFGFAGALGELGLSGAALVPGLAGFNLGVETGQLVIVTIFLPLAFAFRRSWTYRILVMRAGSAAIILISGTWLCERLFDFKLLPF